MRQINIKELKNKLSKELLNLPVEITKHGKVVATIIKGAVNITPKVATIPKKGVHRIEAIKEKLTEITKKKKRCTLIEATIVTEETPTFGYPKSVQCRKKVK